MNHEEIKNLESHVDQYLDFAERPARNRNVMYMIDWKVKLDAFLELIDEKILTHSGKIFAEMAKEFAITLYCMMAVSLEKVEPLVGAALEPNL